MRLHVQLEGKQRLLLWNQRKRIPQINDECMEKILVQLVGAVMEVGNLLKCILVVLVFFGLAILAKIW